MPDSVFEIPGFVMYGKDRPGVKWGGGILAYVNFRLKENCCIKLKRRLKVYGWIFSLLIKKDRFWQVLYTVNLLQMLTLVAF